jgi:hypothetical protein
MFLDIVHHPLFICKHRPVYISKHSVSETGFSLRLQVKPTRLGPLNRASSYQEVFQSQVKPTQLGPIDRASPYQEVFQSQNHFQNKHTLHATLMKTWSVRVAQQTKQCVCSIPCDCGRCYIGETSGPVEVSIKEYKYNLTQSLLQKSKLAQHVYKEGHKICWNEAKVLQIEPNTTYRKYKESAHVSLLDHPISQPSLDISPILTLIITAEVKKTTTTSSVDE